MKRERHPYGTFVPKGAKSMIIGSFPIGKFTDPKRRKEIKESEIDFFFGGEKNLLWKLLGECFNRDLKTRENIISFLEEQKMGIGDVIRSCRRVQGKASDSSLYDIEWNRDLLQIIKEHKIKTLYFTSKGVLRWFKRLFPREEGLQEYLLISPSAQSARSIVRMEEYKKWKQAHPNEKIFSFIRSCYHKIFVQRA